MNISDNQKNIKIWLQSVDSFLFLYIEFFISKLLYCLFIIILNLTDKLFENNGVQKQVKINIFNDRLLSFISNAEIWSVKLI